MSTQPSKKKVIQGLMNTIKNRRFMELPEGLRDDKEIALLAVSLDGGMLEFLSTRLRNDKEIVEKAVSRHPLAVKFASERLLTYELCKEAVKNDFTAYAYIPKKLKEDSFFLALAVASIKYLSNISKAPPELREDKAFMLEALKWNVGVFNYAPTSLKDDFDFVMLSVTNNPGNVRLVSNRLRNDPKIALAVLEKSQYSVKLLGDEIQGMLDEKNPLASIKQIIADLDMRDKFLSSPAITTTKRVKI